MLEPDGVLIGRIRELSRSAYRFPRLGVHSGLMYERLTPKEIALIKREKRKARIRHIRQFVATGAVTLVALFSGVILSRSLTGGTTAGDTAPVTLGQAQVSSGDDETSDDDETLTPETSTTTTVPDPAPSPTPVVTSQS